MTQRLQNLPLIVPVWIVTVIGLLIVATAHVQNTYYRPLVFGLTTTAIVKTNNAVIRTATARAMPQLSVDLTASAVIIDFIDTPSPAAVQMSPTEVAR